MIAERPVALELGLVEELVGGRLVGKRRVAAGVLLKVGGLVAGHRRLDVDEHAGHLAAVDVVVADLADGAVPMREPRRPSS